jgi:integrase
MNMSSLVTEKRVKYAREAWSKECKRAGIPNLRFHDFRRIAVRSFMRAGVSARVAMDISGDKTRCIFDHYKIMVEAELHDAMAKGGKQIHPV